MTTEPIAVSVAGSSHVPAVSISSESYFERKLPLLKDQSTLDTMAQQNCQVGVSENIQRGSERVKQAYVERTVSRGAGRFMPLPRGRSSRRKAPDYRSKDGGGAGGGRRVDVTWAVRHMFGLLKRVVYGRYLRAGSAVADFGHGPGTDLPKFAHARIASLTAVDFVQEALDEAAFRAKTNPRFKRSVRDVQFVQQDLCRVVCRVEPAVDTVTCQFSLHYMWRNKSCIKTILTSIRDSLKSKGHFITIIVDADRIPPEGVATHPFIKISPPTCNQSIAQMKSEVDVGSTAPKITSDNKLESTTTLGADLSKTSDKKSETPTSAAPSTEPAKTKILISVPKTAISNAKSEESSGKMGATVETGGTTTKTSEVVKSGNAEGKSRWDGGHWSYRFTFPGVVNDVEEFVIPADDLLTMCREFSLELVASYNVREKIDEIRGLHTAQPDLSHADWQVLDLYRCYVFQKI